MKEFVRTAIGAAIVAAASVTAQAYPTKPIRIVIGFAPGGPADIVGRLVSPKMSEALTQQAIIENRGGASGTIGAEAVVKSLPNGYTIGLGSSGNLIMAPHLYPKLGYNVGRDIAPISCLAQSAYALSVNPTVPAKTVGELVRIARTRKYSLTYGTSGAGSTSHVAAELFRSAAAVELTHVPFKGTGPSLTAVMAGEIDMMFGDLSPAIPLARNGKLRIIANLGVKRSPAAPEVPTVAESGFKMPPVVGRYILFAPTGTPGAVVSKLHDAAVAALNMPAVQQRLASLGMEAVGDSPEQCAATLKSEGEVYGAVIRKADIKPD